ncbi:MAG: hypothetical protein CMH12_11345 [Maritimibacter sp.]|nr:hypothetical protein [Maritimibacter sp.]MAQ83814.1 hypothetical protein [Maritimibacter sp.]
MRLICPNCGATYEVDAGLVPPAGRDVQCSNCGHGWFQHPEGEDPHEDEDTLASAFAADVAAVDRDEPEDVSVDFPETDAGNDPTRARATYDDDYEEDYEDEATSGIAPAWDAPEDEDEDAAPADIEDDEDPDGDPYPDDSDDEDYDEDEDDAEVDPRTDPAGAAPHHRRELEPGIADILREEAEREAAARRAESSDDLYSQPDLGLDEDDTPEDRSPAARGRVARMRGHGADAPDDSASNRSGLLPDVDEINSTLRGQDERDDSGAIPDMAPPPQAETGMSFKSGFLIVVIIVAILVAVYALAPNIVDAVPAAEPSLRAYVDAVNQLRLAVNGGIESLIAKINGLIGG